MCARLTIERIAIRNFRSIASCDVSLAPLTFLVGANSSGKTSFADALGLIADALSESLPGALAKRGGYQALMYAGATSLAPIEFDVRVSDGPAWNCRYSFALQPKAEPPHYLHVAREECRIREAQGREHFYQVKRGSAGQSSIALPAIREDRLMLVAVSGAPEFRPVFDFLAGLVKREPRSSPDIVASLVPGPNATLTGRFHDMIEQYPDRMEAVNPYLRVIAPPFQRVNVAEIQGSRWLQFLEATNGTERAFYGPQVSTGLMNAAVMLLDLFELPRGAAASPVVIEEPEAFLHPSAVAALRDSFVEASHFRQVIVTSHSPELLDDGAISAECIRLVHRDADGTHISALDAGTASILRDRLSTAGELLRQRALQPVA